MERRLAIRWIEIEESADDGVFVVALSEFEDGSGQAILFQLSTEFDEQDAELGMDTYCISNEVGATIYGGIRSCTLQGNHLTLQFHDDAAGTLAIENECQIQLLVPSDAVTRLRNGLRRVLSAGRGTQPQLNL